MYFNKCDNIVGSVATLWQYCEMGSLTGTQHRGPTRNVVPIVIDLGHVNLCSNIEGKKLTQLII